MTPLIVVNMVEVKKLPKKVCLSETRGKNHKDSLYCGLGNSYSKSCYFFGSNHITLKAYLDDTIYGNEQC